MFKVLTLFLILYSSQAFGLESIWNDLTRSKNRIEKYPDIIEKLIDKEMYHTSVPYIKEYLIASRGRTSKKFEKIFEKVVTKVGDRQFVLLPYKYLAL